MPQVGSFFEDFLALTIKEGSSARDNAPGVFLYLRVINSVHDEIADVLVPRSLEEQGKNNDLKDLVRHRDVQRVVHSWQEILSEWRERDAGAVDLCLRAIGRWVSWIDISLVVNEQLLSILFQLVGYARAVSGNLAEDNVRDAAIDTFTEIVGKK
jgi:exportin-T